MIIGCCINKTDDIARVREAGFDYFEFSAAALAAMSEEAFDALLLAADRARLPCLGLNSFSSGVPAFVGSAYSREAAAKYVRKLCGRAARLHVRTVGIGAPKARVLPAGFPTETADEQMREFLTLAAQAFGQIRVRLALEALHDKTCNYINTVSEALAFLDRFGLDDVGLVLDFYHMQVMGEGLEWIEKAAPRLLHVHVSTCGPHLERSFPLMDELDSYREIVRSLRSSGYDRTLSIEPNAFEPEKAPDSLRMLRLACEA